MLKVNNIEVVYNDVILALRGISLQVSEKNIIVLLGANGAGKNTTVEKFVDALETLKDFDCGGMLSPMTYTPTIHKPSDYSKIVKADTEKLVFVPVTKWIKPQAVK
jgi:ABC-type dipeptide/oligopeptide/nickel transport system ATPase component